MKPQVDSGAMNKGQEIAALMAFDAQVYQLELQAADREIALEEQGTAAYQSALNRKLQIQNQYELNRQRLIDQGVSYEEQQQKKLQQSMTSVFSQTINAMENSHKSFNQFIEQQMRNLVNNVFDKLFEDIVAKWAVMEMKKLGVSQLYDNLLVALHLKTAVADAAAATVGNEAEKASYVMLAGAAGTASMAGAPWPIDTTAPDFGADMAMAAAAYSAAGGMDVPSYLPGGSVNTRIHPEEMILPADLAGGVRNMVSNGVTNQTGAQRSGALNLSSVKGLDPKKLYSHRDVLNMFNKGKRQFAF